MERKDSTFREYCKFKLAIMLRLSFLLLSMTLISCMNDGTPNIQTPLPTSYESIQVDLNEVELMDRILGALVGSAIGDAMGASTEMWDRKDIQAKYGYIVGLTDAIREKSPEGTWQHNMVAGSTTDDTRWKFFFGQYLSKHGSDISSENFASFIVDYYQSLIKQLPDSGSAKSTDRLDEELEKVNWIKEWARFAMAYGKGDTEFAAAQNRFYGGEMSCAGMLYSPMLGLVAISPGQAYEAAFEHAIFDIGYARDISSLVSVMTYRSMQGLSIDSIIDESLLVDPFKYNDSRLIGRLAASLADEARGMVRDEIVLPELAEGESLAPPPVNYVGSAEDWHRQSVIYDRMARKQKAVAFHAGEIWQILIAGLTYGQGDFMKTMQFIVNYGRDNDTVAAVAGMILGAKLGFEELPAEIRDEVMKVSNEVMKINLELLALQLTQINNATD
jgi:ADP-ribosylglycohydrolase